MICAGPLSGSTASVHLTRTRIQSATALGIAANWTDISTNTADANGSWTYTASKTGAAQRFFRVVIR